MDNLRGTLSGYGMPEDDGSDYDRAEDEAVRELPPAAIGTDERRMQVRAYNFWASLLANRTFPSIEDLDLEHLPDFGPYSVLLDFSLGIEDPAIVFLGEKLASECGASGPIAKLSDVPSRSLLSRITDHHLQIIANQAPIGFEAEFTNQHGTPVMYRGILLPFSSDDDSIDFIFGVINWKELADQQTTDELLLEIDQALAAAPEPARLDGPLTEWADGPVDLAPRRGADDAPDADDDWPEPAFGGLPGAEVSEPADEDEEFDEPEMRIDLGNWDIPAAGPADPAEGVVFDPHRAGGRVAHDINADLPPLPAEPPAAAQPAPMELADWLASARELALAARGAEDRSRLALYAAIGRAYDFALAAAADPTGLAELIADAGLVPQERAPMTPLVKLVFGADYDKTRLAEYAAVLAHASRLAVGQGGLEAWLSATPGGLKAVVAAERKLRRGESAAIAAPRLAPGERLARRLRKLAPLPLDAISPEGSEFALLVARRLPDGQVVLLGEVSDDAALVERAARRLIG
jgi:hypothetical protein